jgi:hypothetical protein
MKDEVIDQAGCLENTPVSLIEFIGSFPLCVGSMNILFGMASLPIRFLMARHIFFTHTTWKRSNLFNSGGKSGNQARNF